jgi:hypothetical protein
MKTSSFDPFDAIAAYENGKLNEEEIIQLFQNLIDTGVVWVLQGHYRRTALALILSGYCHKWDARDESQIDEEE